MAVAAALWFCRQYIKKNKADDNDWFKLESNAEGTKYVFLRGPFHLLAPFPTSRARTHTLPALLRSRPTATGRSIQNQHTVKTCVLLGGGPQRTLWL